MLIKFTKKERKRLIQVMLPININTDVDNIIYYTNEVYQIRKKTFDTSYEININTDNNLPISSLKLQNGYNISFINVY